MGKKQCRKLGHRIEPFRRFGGLGTVFGMVAAALSLSAGGLAAQATGTITGRVTDGTTAQPIASAQISIAGLGIGTLTQQNGRFVLQNVPAGTHTVTAQRIGYRTETAEVSVAADGAATLDFVINESALALDEIIVTGTPGATERRAIGNSVARLDAAQVTETAVITGIQDLLSARTPGLRFGRVDGQVGGGSGIAIRGVSSVSLGAQPLIYIDGVRVDNSATKGPNTGSSTNASAMGDLNPEEIESIEVIKGPAAATLYGTEASAGVIQIITKKGAVGAPEFTFEVAGGLNYMRNPARMLGPQYACAVVVGGACPEEHIVRYNMYDEANDFLRHRGRFAGLDLPFPARDRDLFGYGPSQRYTLSARGGTDQVRYYLSTTFNDETGVLDYNTNESTNLRANVSVLLSENLTIDVSTGYGQGSTQFATVDAEGGVWHQLVWGRGYNLPGVREPEGVGFLGFQERWPQNFEDTDITREYSRFTGSATATHTYNDWLTQRLIFGVDRGWDTNTEYLPGGNNWPAAENGMIRYERPLEQNVTFDYAASARYQFNDGIRTTTSVGAQWYSNFEENLTNFGSDFPTPIQRVIDATEFGNRQIDFSSVENKSFGIYVQEEIALNDRLYLTAAVRADDNSAFGSEFDLQYYPKFSVSYVVSEESFFERFDVIDNLRLRGAWGKAGRQPRTFAALTLYTTMLGPNGNGLVPDQPGNTEIGPEVSTELELGFDIAMLQDRLAGEFTWYTRTTEDMLVNQSLSPSFGLTGFRQANLGEMKNWGWEASLNARLYQGRTSAFDLAVSGDYTTNEIVSLGEDVLPSGNFQIGWPYPNISTDYWIVDAKFDENNNVIRETVMCDGGRPAVPGGPNIMPGGEIIPCSEYDEDGMLLGPTYPNYTFAISPTLTLFNNALQVFALAEGQYGRWIASVDAQYACAIYSTCLKAHTRDDPLFMAGTRMFTDDRYIGRYPADFWKLRQVGARYNLPGSLVSRFGVDRASITVSANNIATLWQKTKTDRAGAWIFDPEYAINGSDPQQTALWEMPGISRVNASIRIVF